MRAQGNSNAEVLVYSDYVYVHTNIKDISYDDEQGGHVELYEYDEVAYPRKEYEEKMLGENLPKAKATISDILEGMDALANAIGG